MEKYNREEFEEVITGRRYGNRNNQSQVASPEFAGTESLEEAENFVQMEIWIVTVKFNTL